MSSAPEDTESQPCGKLDEPSHNEEIECSVCLLTAVHPVKLPCSHIFCYLCVKGIANRSKKCALCRQEISPQFLIKPNLIKTEDLDKEVAFEDGYQWFYEGNRGWWQYDERTSQELENTFKEDKEKKLEILIAGFLYVIDFGNMVQYRRNDPNRRRRIKRDHIGIPKKGIAGLRVKKPVVNVPDRREGDGGDNEEIVVNTQVTGAVIPQAQNSVQTNDSSGSVNVNTDTHVADLDRVNKNTSAGNNLMENSISHNGNGTEILQYINMHNEGLETSSETVENSNNEAETSISSTLSELRLRDDTEEQTNLSTSQSS